MPTKVVSKKTAPKTAVNKSSVKKVATRVTKPKKLLVYADHQRSFWVVDGQILNSLLALRDAFATMSKTTYQYHTSLEHNDFATWVALVLDDVVCAEALRTAKTAASAKAIVVRHLKGYDL